MLAHHVKHCKKGNAEILHRDKWHTEIGKLNAWWAIRVLFWLADGVFFVVGWRLHLGRRGSRARPRCPRCPRQCEMLRVGFAFAAVEKVPQQSRHHWTALVT